MNKVVPSVMTISAVLFMAGCASSGVKSNPYANGGANNAAYAYQANQANRVAYQGNANYQAGQYQAAGQYQQVNCQSCGQGSHAVAHDHGHSRSATGAVVTHRHAGTAGHAHSGMSGSHSYVTTTAGRNASGYAVNNAGYVNNAANAGGVARAGGGVGSTLVKAAGVLLVGGLIYKATKDDDDNGDDNSTDTTTEVKDDGK